MGWHWHAYGSVSFSHICIFCTLCPSWHWFSAPCTSSEPPLWVLLLPSHLFSIFFMVTVYASTAVCAPHVWERGEWVQVCTWMTHVWKSLDNLKYGSQVPFVSTELAWSFTTQLASLWTFSSSAHLCLPSCRLYDYKCPSPSAFLWGSGNSNFNPCALFSRK